jgi:hypothetical protein
VLEHRRRHVLAYYGAACLEASRPRRARAAVAGVATRPHAAWRDG